ncbi:hypothetical protein ABCS02_28105 [Microbacterium sp. X-17]|uniref:hypothetical protein n=1 Tax=Microbacterium sp. X-17 TaxID=3144404 RepID=UPI0031F49CE8
MADLERFAAATGELPRRNARLDADHVNPREDRLANFLSAQRRRRAVLTSEQIGRIEALPGFSWTPLSDAWEANVRDYGAFYLSHGRLPSGASKDPRERRLEAWASEQRGLARGVEGRNPPTRERLEQLGDIPGWRWDNPVINDVEDSLIADLRLFVTETGRDPRNVRARSGKTLTPEEADEGRLRRWIDRLAKRSKAGTLDAELESKVVGILGSPLDSIGRNKRAGARNPK